MDQQLIGRTLLGCRIQSVIGRGAAGTVFLAHHLQIDCLRAIKVLKPHLANDPEKVQRFRSEARSAARICHENLVTLHNADEVDGYFAYVMEFVEGQTLAQRVTADGPLDRSEAVNLLCQACAGLTAAHLAGITHRDIKPDNLLLTGSGQLKIADFGLSRATDNQRLTQQGQAVGTPPYMSPEQCRGEEADPRSDIYSLGLVGYYLLTGTEPMLAESSMATMYNQVNEDPDPPHLLQPSIGAPLSDVICRMLAKNPAERQPDAETVIEELQAAQAGTRSATRRILPRAPSMSAGPPPSSSLPPVSSGVKRQLVRYLIVLIVGLLAGWLLRGPFQQTPRAGSPLSKNQAQDQTNYMAQYIQALERGDEPAAFELLARQLIQHPRDWETHSKRIDLARQLNRILEVFPDLKALDDAGRLSDRETQLLMDIYLKQEQHKQASQLMQRVARRNPKLASQLALDRARQYLAAGRPFEAARVWLQTLRETDPGPLFLATLKRELHRRRAGPKRKASTDRTKLLMDLTLRDSRFFHWPSLADWFSADPRRVRPLSTKLLLRVIVQSSRDRKWDGVGQTSGQELVARDRKYAESIVKSAYASARASFKVGRNDEGVQHLTRCLSLKPEAESAALRWTRGEAYFRLGQRILALADISELLRLQPSYRGARNLRALIYNDRGLYQLAIRDLTVAIKATGPAHPEYPFLFGNRGLAHLLSDKPGKARADFERALRFKSHPGWRIGLLLSHDNSAAGQARLANLLDSGTGQMLAPLMQKSAYSKVATRAIAVLPDHPLTHAERGNLQLRLGNRAAAVRDLERALKLCTAQHVRHTPGIRQALANARSLPRKKKQ